MNEHLQARLDAMLLQLQAVHGGGASMSSASKGSEREAFVDLLLRGCLPMPYRFGSGDIADAHGKRSGQIDLVVEHPFFPSFPLLGTSQQRLYLIEGVALAVEVKSSCGQWGEAGATMRRLLALQPGADWPPDHPRSAFSGGVGQSSHTTFPGRVGFAIVLYDGWANAETLARHCEEDDVDVALQISPPIFHARHFRTLSGMPRGEPVPKTVKGSAALAAFIFVLCEELRALSHYDSNMFRRYVERVPPPYESMLGDV